MMRWGFLGASRIGRRALAPAVLDAGHTLHAVAARDLERATDFAHAFGSRRPYGDYPALLADPAVDAVYIALPNDAHLPWTLRALAAGKHVLCEKPLALNAAEVATMQEAEARSGRRVLEAFCHVHHPQLARVQALLAAGAIGDLVAMQAVFTGNIEDPADFRWQADKGGGALYDLGTYCVSLMRVLAGEPRAVSGHQALRGGVDASFTGQLDFGPVAGQFTCSLAAARSQHLELIGTAGTLLLDWPISTKGKETGLFLNDRAERFPATDPYVRMLNHFVKLASGPPDQPYGLAWSHAQARTLDALFEAARTGRSVGLEK